jgi:hypothetical protein
LSFDVALTRRLNATETPRDTLMLHNLAVGGIFVSEE